MEEKVDGKSPSDEGAEIQSPKRKVIRVESEETQGLCERIIELEPGRSRRSQFRIKRDQHRKKGQCFGCDNRCSAKALRFWQFASTVIDDGVQFVPAVLQRELDGTGPGAVQELAVEGSCGKEGRILADYGVLKDQNTRNVGVLSFERTKAKKFLKDAEKEKQEGIQGQWQQEAPAKEYLEQVKGSADTDCTPRTVKFGYFALKGGEWEACKSIFKVGISATEWAFERIREACEKVAGDEAGRLNIVEGSKLRSTEFLRRIIAPAGGQGGVTMSYLCPKCNSFPPGGLHVMGFSWKEAHKLVVRNLLRKI